MRLDHVYNANMASNANSVNIKLIKDNYHHGDLRSAAMDEGLRLLENGHADHISLREIARNVGVSAPALYRHFPNKDSLLSALAEEGMKRLATLQANQGGAGGAEDFAASGRAYVRFAMANPALFRLIFSSMCADAHPFEESKAGSPAHLLRGHVAEVLGPDVPDEKKFTVALRAWALVHGLAMLILDRQLAPEIAEAMIDQVIDTDSLRLN